MGVCLLRTLGCILFCAVLNKPIKGDRLTLEVPDIPVYYGDTVYLTCRYKAAKRWMFFKNGSTLQVTNEDSYFNSGAMEINSLTTSNDMYKCETEKQQSAEKQLSITAKRRRIHLSASDSGVPGQGTVTLSCDIEGFTGRYMWTRENSSETEQWETSSPSVTISRGGVYTCRGYANHVQTIRSNAVTISEREESSQFPVMFVVRHIVGIGLVLLLFLIVLIVTKGFTDKWRSSVCLMTNKTKETNQNASADHMICTMNHDYENTENEIELTNEGLQR